jgi:glycosyltransferase involved in cell wall biosynthesis
MSNRLLTDKESGSTGTWLGALARSLIQSGEIELGNISLGNVSRLSRLDCSNLTQYVVSSKANDNNTTGLPSRLIVNDIIKAVEEFAPDLIHVWGTELSWGLLTARKTIKLPALLDIQGLKSAIAKVYDGGLTYKEKLACIGLKEVLRQTTIFQGKSKFERWSRFEKEIISGNSYITTQSSWLEARVRAINKTCKMFHNEFALQEPFYSATPWSYPENVNIFCSTSYPSPFKGLHVAIRAVAILKERFPNIQLRIAGAYPKKGIRQDGFVAWLVHEANKLGVKKNLFWLGPLSVGDIINELQTCAATLLPTFIEGYCLALAEAMMIGAPTVVSFTGGTSYLARDNETALFFPPGDEAMCAYQLERLLLDRELGERLSILSRQKALVRNDRDQIIRQQMNIYRQVLEATKNNVN